MDIIEDPTLSELEEICGEKKNFCKNLCRCGENWEIENR